MRKNGGFDATIDFNSNFLPDPTLMLQKLISKDRSPQNYSGYTDRELDKLFDAQSQEADSAKRKILVQQFERRTLEASYTIPLTYMNRSIALDAKIKGYKIAPSLVLNTNWRGVWLEE
ncbi:MAG: peptide/nickel transport system substrate-binding protein [Alphaproteobacteria bacterium]